jgi:hypothetical protein
MKKISVVTLMLVLGGCAHAPMPMVSQPLPHHKLVAKPVIVPPVTVAPPATFKKRWFDRFPKHPPMFHTK